MSITAVMHKGGRGGRGRRHCRAGACIGSGARRRRRSGGARALGAGRSWAPVRPALLPSCWLMGMACTQGPQKMPHLGSPWCCRAAGASSRASAVEPAARGWCRCSPQMTLWNVIVSSGSCDRARTHPWRRCPLCNVAPAIWKAVLAPSYAASCAYTLQCGGRAGCLAGCCSVTGAVLVTTAVSKHAHSRADAQKPHQKVLLNLGNLYRSVPPSLLFRSRLALRPRAAA